MDVVPDGFQSARKLLPFRQALQTQIRNAGRQLEGGVLHRKPESVVIGSDISRTPGLEPFVLAELPMGGSHGVAPFVSHVGAIMAFAQRYVIVASVEVKRQRMMLVNMMYQGGVDIIERILDLLVVSPEPAAVEEIDIGPSE